MPVYKLLGGSYDDGVPMHFSISIRTPEEMGEDTAARVAEGFRTIEVKLGRLQGELDLQTEIARIAAIRAAAGPDVVIVADPNQPKPMTMLGHVTSSYWSDALGRSIAMAVVADGRARDGETLHVPMPNGTITARVVKGTVFLDPENSRLSV